MCNCYRPPCRDVIDLCANIESVVENATLNHFYFLDEIYTFGLMIRLLHKIELLK